MFELQNISFSYQNEHILNDVNLTIHDGEYVLLLGPNGAGKSTLVKCLLGLNKPTNGQVRIDGIPLDKYQDWGKIGYVSQRATHLDVMLPLSVAEVVAMGEMKHVAKEAIAQQLEIVGLPGFEKRNIHKLSGGQQQRVFIARALMSNPQAIVLDEPTVGLDIATTRAFYELLDQLHQAGKTIIMVTHDMHLLTASANRIISVNRGINFDGTRQAYDAWHENNCVYCDDQQEEQRA